MNNTLPLQSLTGNNIKNWTIHSVWTLILHFFILFSYLLSTPSKGFKNTHIIWEKFEWLNKNTKIGPYSDVCVYRLRGWQNENWLQKFNCTKYQNGKRLCHSLNKNRKPTFFTHCITKSKGIFFWHYKCQPRAKYHRRNTRKYHALPKQTREIIPQHNLQSSLPWIL